jgi:hypothetical protein
MKLNIPSYWRYFITPELVNSVLATTVTETAIQLAYELFDPHVVFVSFLANNLLRFFHAIRVEERDNATSLPVQRLLVDLLYALHKIVVVVAELRHVTLAPRVRIK